MRRAITPLIKAAILSALPFFVLSSPVCAQSLIEAAQSGDAIQVARLMEAGEDIDMPDADGIPPLMWAIMRGHEDVAVLLLENGAVLKTARNYDEARIILGIVKDARRAAELLVKRGPYIQAGQNYGSILFINALRYGRKDVARVLIESEIQLKLPDDEGVTPIAYSTIFGHKTLAERLYGGGAYFYETSMGEDEVINMARARGDDEIVDFISRMAIEKIPEGELTLAKAIKDGNAVVLEELIRRGADVNATDSSGDTPLYIAAGKGNPRAVKLLLDAGADPNIGCRAA